MKFVLNVYNNGKSWLSSVYWTHLFRLVSREELWHPIPIPSYPQQESFISNSSMTGHNDAEWYCNMDPWIFDIISADVIQRPPKLTTHHNTNNAKHRSGKLFVRNVTSENIGKLTCDGITESFLCGDVISATNACVGCAFYAPRLNTS